MPIFSRTAKGGGHHGSHSAWHTQDARDIDCAATGCMWNLGKKCMVPSQSPRSSQTAVLSLKTMNTGIIGETNAAYHSNPAISHSNLCDFMEQTGGSKLRFYHRHVLKIIAPEEAPHLEFGSAFHLLMEDTEKFKAVAVSSKFENYRTSEAKTWRDEMIKAGKIILNKEDEEALALMHGRVLKHPIVQELIADTQAELTWRKRYSDVFSVQCRTDRYKPGIAVDWKTVSSLNAFKKDAINFSYHTQAAYYQEVIAACQELPADAPRPRMIYVAVEKEPPFEVQPFEFDQDSLTVARAEIIMALKHLRRCFETNEWERTPNIETIRLPVWSVKQAEERLIELQKRLELPA